MMATPEQFDAFYRAEREKWGKVIKETGMDKGQGNRFRLMLRVL